MEPWRVTISATDPVSRAGIRHYLDGNPAVAVVDDGDDTKTDLRPLILVAALPESDLLPAINLGVMAVLSPSTLSRTELTTALTEVLAGHYVMPPRLTGELVRHITRLQHEVLAPNGLSRSGLSTREIEVLRLLADGLDTTEIAAQLNYADRTVKNIVKSINAKLGLRNRTHAVSHALRHGLI